MLATHKHETVHEPEAEWLSSSYKLVHIACHLDFTHSKHKCVFCVWTVVTNPRACQNYEGMAPFAPLQYKATAPTANGTMRHWGRGGPTRVAPSRGWHPNEIYFFVAELTKKTGQTTLEGGEGGSGDETTAKK